MHHIFGHTSPDTDAFASAFALAYWLNAQHINAIAYRLGEPNLETAFVIRHLFAHFTKDFADTPSQLLPYLDPNNPLATLQHGDKIGLTDHNESSQSIANVGDFDICFVIDHHKINLATPHTAYVRISPVGCTCTILYEMFAQKAIAIPPSLAMLMLSAIISDTLNLTSPTTTNDDRQVVENLLKIIGLSHDDKDKFAHAMFMAKSDISHLDARQILLMDYKEYDFCGHKWGIAGIETLNSEQVLARRDELSVMANTLKSDKNLDHLMIAIADIGTKTGYALAYDDAQNTIIAQAFNAKASDDGVFTLSGVVSRKRQIVPALENYYRHTPNNTT
ncbi:manganese-dependent inorganic pyrophosphatase [Moraxella nasibovis]|uniref:manganese-dependent inorganic pyrophosphatase n=1 Tax=Moraxella nasibovis TaxID=2904120 RepID=UPI00240FBEE3|nr:manganese-dependent inorganic pyrophosphatase [Moraxella nasibovis]WFF38287.1 manganese-dependent inorganic pyrophosphatase [Moraxella nasibovis]